MWIFNIVVLGCFQASLKWKQNTLDLSRQNVASRLAALSASCASIVTLTSGKDGLCLDIKHLCNVLNYSPNLAIMLSIITMRTKVVKAAFLHLFLCHLLTVLYLNLWCIVMILTLSFILTINIYGSLIYRLTDMLPVVLCKRETVSKKLGYYYNC